MDVDTRLETFVRAREVGLSIECKRLRKKFQAMLLDSDPKMYIFSDSETKNSRRKRDSSTSVIAKDRWFLTDINQELFNGELNVDTVAQAIVSMGIIEKKDESYVLGKQGKLDFFYNGQLKKDELSFSNDGINYIRNRVAQSRARNVARKNREQGFIEEPLISIDKEKPFNGEPEGFVGKVKK